MLIWIFFWWLLGVIVLCTAFWHEGSLIDLRRIELGDALAVLLGALVWPIVALLIAIDNDWLDVPVFDLNWFRRNRDE